MNIVVNVFITHNSYFIVISLETLILATTCKNRRSLKTTRYDQTISYFAYLMANTFHLNSEYRFIYCNTITVEGNIQKDLDYLNVFVDDENVNGKEQLIM